MTSLLYSQEVFRLGVVEGDSVAYQVRVRKILHHQWLIRNMDNPDTTLKPIPQRAIHTAQETDMDMQIAEIIHDNLSEEDLSELKKQR